MASYYAAISSRKHDAMQNKYGLFHGNEEMNYWDYASIGFFVLAVSASIVAIWVRKFDD